MANSAKAAKAPLRALALPGFPSGGGPEAAIWRLGQPNMRLHTTKTIKRMMKQ